MKIQQYIDHTILKPDAVKTEVIKICKEAREYNFASVCVNPYYTALVCKELEGSNVKTCVVVGFPLGANTREIKALEASMAVKDGADEVDMVINIGALKDKNYTYVEQEIKAVANAIKGNALLKVIIECCLLTDEEKVIVCELSKKAGADYVKTSTGFSIGGAKTEDIALMRKTVGSDMGVKAAGGIRDFKTAKAMIDVGASRIGASAGIKIVKENTEK